MKTATFTYMGNPTGRKEEKVHGSVTLKNDGKVSISLNALHCSYAAKYNAKKLAKDIADSDFAPNNPAITSLKCDGISLVAVLTEKTQDLKAWFIEKTKERAKANWKWSVQKLAQPDEKWHEQYQVKTKETIYYNGTKGIGFEYDKNYYKMTNAKRQLSDFIKGGFPKFEAKEVRMAELHYVDCVTKLSNRLAKKGVTDANQIQITSGRVGVNLEVTIKHGTEITRAWTIIAEGPIQIAHYRYLVK